MISQIQLIGIYIPRNDILHPHLRQGHLILRQRPSLIRANTIRSSHRLTCLQLPHQILILKHFLHRERKRQGYSKGKAFWNSHDNDCDTDDEVVKDVLEVGPIEFLGLGDSVEDEEDG